MDAAARGLDRETPLLTARQLFFEGGDPELGERIIHLLREAGASPDARDGLGYTALITAAVNDKPRLARLMLSLGADPHIQCEDDKTALAWARELGHREIEEILVEHGARF